MKIHTDLLNTTNYIQYTECKAAQLPDHSTVAFPSLANLWWTRPLVVGVQDVEEEVGLLAEDCPLGHLADLQRGDRMWYRKASQSNNCIPRYSTECLLWFHSRNKGYGGMIRPLLQRLTTVSHLLFGYTCGQKSAFVYRN